jgi:hypothetical protein
MQIGTRGFQTEAGVKYICVCVCVFVFLLQKAKLCWYTFAENSSTQGAFMIGGSYPTLLCHQAHSQSRRLSPTLL